LHATLREIDILRDVSHSNIVKLYEVYESQRHIYLVMQFLPGGTLHDKLIYGKPMREDLVVQLTRKLL
jgi:serine/threonine protein kinase